MKVNAALLAIFFVITSTAASAEVNVEWRPDLSAHIKELRLVYPFPEKRTGLRPFIPEDEMWWRIRDAGTAVYENEYSPEIQVLSISGDISAASSDAASVLDFMHGGSNFGQWLPTYVVLEGGGGDFGEALRIAQNIRLGTAGQDPYIEGVLIREGTECLSACAFVAALIDVSTIVEPGAKLGFHLPYIPSETLARQIEEANLSIKVAFDTIAALSDLIVTERYHPMLLTRLLEQRESNDYYTLSGTAETWKIGFDVATTTALADLVSPHEFDFYLAERVCDLLVYGTYGYAEQAFIEWLPFWSVSSLRSEYKDSYADNLSTFAEGEHGYALRSDSGTCAFQINSEGGLTFSLAQDPTFEVRCIGDVRDPLPGQAPLAGMPLQGSGSWCKTERHMGTNLTKGFVAAALGCWNNQLVPTTFRDFEGNILASFRYPTNVYSEPKATANMVGQFDSNGRFVPERCLTDNTTGETWFWGTASQSGLESAGWVIGTKLGDHNREFLFQFPEYQ